MTRVMRDWPKLALSFETKVTMQTNAMRSARMSGFLTCARWSAIDTSERDLRPVGPLGGLGGCEDTRSERVEGDLGHLNG